MSTQTKEIRVQTIPVYLKMMHSSLLLLSAVVHKDLNNVQVISSESYL